MKNIRQTIGEIGHKPVRGQNFLASEPVINTLVKEADVDDEKVLEIGAGTGAITSELIETAAHVTAFEIEHSLAEYLRKQYSSETNIEIREEDFLEAQLDEYTRCVANLPFQHTSEMLEILGKKQIMSSLIVQDEIA